MDVRRGLFVDWYGSIDAKFYNIIVVTKRGTMYQCRFYQQPPPYILRYVIYIAIILQRFFG